MFWKKNEWNAVLYTLFISKKEANKRKNDRNISRKIPIICIYIDGFLRKKNLFIIQMHKNLYIYILYVCCMSLSSKLEPPKELTTSTSAT